MTKQVVVSEEEVKIIISALKHAIVAREDEEAVWNLIERLEKEMNK